MVLHNSKNCITFAPSKLNNKVLTIKTERNYEQRKKH